jgi:TIM-barrel protein
VTDVRLALASLSGQADAGWARDAAEYADAAFLGGIALDERTRAAARRMVERDREEFLPADPAGFVDDQLATLDDIDVVGGFNVRTTTLDPLRRVATICRDHDAIVEINAHCRQEEMCAAGCGESLLEEPERLGKQVATAAATGATVSVKVRAEVPGVDLPAVAATADRAGADYIHVDAMDSEPVVADVARRSEARVIANNGVRDEATVAEYLEHGADAVSVGRASDDPATLARVREAATAWFESGRRGEQSRGVNP